MNRERYMAELDRLLGFMSSWDRQAALKKYQALIDAAPDEEALFEELGTPTKLAIDLAASYVPSPSPSMRAEALLRCPVALEDLLDAPGVLAADLSAPEPEEAEPAEDAAPRPETWVFDPEPAAAPELTADAGEAALPAEAPAAPEARVRVRGGALAAYLVPAILIGLPVTVALVCLGLPFLCGGAAVIVGAVYGGIQVITRLTLVSDMLLSGGFMLLLCAAGLVLCWFGLWLSMELCWLWAGRCVCGLGRRLCMREEAA